MFKKKEHHERFHEALEAFGLDSLDVQAALYLLTYDEVFWEQAKPAFGEKSFQFIESAHWPGEWRQLFRLAGHLYNNRDLFSLGDLYLLSLDWFEVALEAIRVRRVGVSESHSEDPEGPDW